MTLIGFRLSECFSFCFEPRDGTHHPVRLDKDDAAIHFSDDQKSGVECEVPLTDEAVACLRQLERTSCTIWPFRAQGSRGVHKSPDRLGRVLLNAGTAANVVVKRWQKANGMKLKHASAHDFRRTFATNLERLSIEDPLTTRQKMKLTRHSNPEVLFENYIDAPTPVLFEKLRGK